MNPAFWCDCCERRHRRLWECRCGCRASSDPDDRALNIREAIDDTPQVEEAFTLWCKSKFGDEFEFFNSDPKSSPFFAAFLAGWQARESKVSK